MRRISQLTRKRITIRDVAAHAGVSHQTVSRVLNNSEHVNPETRARVEVAIQKLGYQPNAIARSMARGKTSMLACIAPNLTDYTFASIINGAETTARAAEYFLLAASAPTANIFAALIDQLVISRRVEGLIVINPFVDNRYQYLPENFPAVLAGTRPRADALPSVSLDDVEAGYLATNHLLELGHHHIAMITGPMEEDCAQDRQAGYMQALVEHGLAILPHLIVEGDWSASSGYAAFEQLTQRGTQPTAVFAQNDQMAIGVMRAATNLGLSIPGQISVIGIDDIPMASYYNPPLTTLKQNFTEIGQQAASMLLAAIKNPDILTYPEHRQLSAQFIHRQSTAKINTD